MSTATYQAPPAATPLPSGLDRVLATARAHAEAVDRDGRFPAETLSLLREEGFLGALLPPSHIALDRAVAAAASTCYALARCCSSSAMVLAMHHTQAACLSAHAGPALWLRRYAAAVARDGLLLASVTSEAGVGGAMRTSLCAVEAEGADRFTLHKAAPTVSYGAFADALLVTARAHPGTDAADQVLVVVPAAPGVLARTGSWNAMGMRGTCSDAFMLSASGSIEQVFTVPFAKIAADTMVPVSHLLWSSVWCGIAADAVLRARRFVRARMRAGSGAMPEGAGRLVRAMEQVQSAEALVRQALASHGAGASFAAAAETNMLKTAVSEACLGAVEDALLLCGFAGYSNEGPYSLSRHLRDLHSARLMIHNDRIRDGTAKLLMLQAPTLGL